MIVSDRPPYRTRLGLPRRSRVRLAARAFAAAVLATAAAFAAAPPASAHGAPARAHTAAARDVTALAVQDANGPRDVNRPVADTLGPAAERLERSGAKSISLGLAVNFPDPSFIKVGGTYYAFATGDGFPVASASSIRGPWKLVGKAMPTRPKWTVKPAKGTWDWAPDVFRRKSDGKFIMYYTAHDRSSDRQCIGVAVAASPAGPYVDANARPRVCPPNGRAVLDPSPFTKLDGTHWMIYNMEGGHIRATRMKANQTSNAGEPPITLISSGTIIEAPVILRSGPRLVMFTSRNHYAAGCSYKTQAFVSVGLDPGTWKSAGDVLTRANSGVCGPGGADLLKTGGKTWIMFHGWRCKQGESCDVADRNDPNRYRAMFVGTIGWGADNLTPRIQ